ncbi:formylglycine-generating enzyme family protein, partial [bacterium]|nr:formylglycine-generating enzyme family protein [bacterium]
ARVRRGGSFYGDNTSEFCRVSYRSSGTPTERYSNVGFRIVLEP